MFWFKRRPNPLFERATAVESLGRAWRRVKANGGGPGGDGMPLEVFARHLDERLAGLSRHLSEGSYRPAPLREAVISKKDGTDRKLRVPSIVDRVAQAAVATVLSEQLDGTMSEGSFGYRPGRSVAQAIERVRAARRAGCGWVVDGDIRRFFDNVPRKAIKARLRDHRLDPALNGLIAQWLDQWGPVGLPQGSPLSPVLANLVLAPLDQCAEAIDGCVWVRYADDFVLSCPTRPVAEKGLRLVRRSLGAIGLDLHTEKTRIVPPWEPLDFLGVTLGASVSA